VGENALARLAETSVSVFGLGGVGSWAAEALVRSGIGHLMLVDSDSVCVTNINRQAQAVPSPVGIPKTEALRDRLKSINKGCEIVVLTEVFSRENAHIFGLGKRCDAPDGAGIGSALRSPQYIIDAIDILTHKAALIELASENGVTLYSSMGMAGKLDPTRIRVADIWETQGCPLASRLRQRLRKDGFAGNVKVVFSAEKPLRDGGAAVSCGTGMCLCPAKKAGADGCRETIEWCSGRKIINGSCITVTASDGMALASLVLRNIAEKDG
jgi:tRNA A37 threonylcarbamoyladenosine dehydratase